MTRAVTMIIVHCAATRPDWMHGHTPAEKWAEIRRWHLARRFRDVGYHYGIDRDGTVILGRPLDQEGAHVRGHNADSIGICLFGGHGSAETDAFEDNFTPDQDVALRRVLANMRKRFGDDIAIHGHNEFAAKACPGFMVAAYLHSRAVIDAPVAPTENEPPAQGIWAALVGAILSIFGGRK